MSRHATRVHDFAWRHDDALSATSVHVRALRTATSIPRTSSCDDAVDAGPSRRSSTGSSRSKVRSPTTSATFCDTNERRARAFEPAFSRGLVDGGVDLPSDWRQTARVADLSALCELLTRPATPSAVVEEIRELVLATIDGRAFMSS